MTESSAAVKPARTTLTVQRVLAGAIELADEIGIEAFTIRKLAAALGVKPMTIYHHIESKDLIIDGMVDAVFGEIDLPPTDVDWKTAIRRRSISMRAVLADHGWAAPLMESRTSPGQATMRHHDAVLGCFRRGGLPLAMVAHAYAVVDSYVYGFALQEANLPFNGEEEIGELAAAIIESFPAQEYPHLFEFITEHVLRPGYAFGNSFEFGLDLLLEGIEATMSPSEA